jgi:hypothetical protein
VHEDAACAPGREASVQRREVLVEVHACTMS